MGKDATYRIVVRGELDPRYAYLFNGSRMELVEGNTVLDVADQAQLNGYLERFEELGVELLTVDQKGSVA